MSTQTTHWRKIAVKLIALLLKSGKTYEEIAKTLGIDETTVRVIQHRWGKIYLG